MRPGVGQNDSDEQVPEEILLSDEDEARCRAYSHARTVLMLVECALLVGVLTALTLTGAARTLLEVAHVPGVNEFGADLLFLTLVGFVTRVLVFPLHYLSEFRLERRFGLSTQSLSSWLWEWLCRNTVFGVATVILLLPIAETVHWQPLWAVLWCAGFLFGRALFYDWVYYPLLSVFYPVRYLRSETFYLPGVGRMTLPVYEVKVSPKTKRVSASIRLRGKKTAIYVTDTLIDEFTDGEERVVMAHEFGHLYDKLHLEERTRAGVAQAHRKLALGSAQLLAGGVSLVLLYFLAPRIGLHSVRDLAGFPLLAAMTLVLAQVFSPMLYAEARKDERDADEYALAVTGDRESYISVMRKLRLLNLEEHCSSPLLGSLFDSHPSYAERVRLALSYRRRHPAKHKAPHWRGWRNVQRHGRR